MTLRISREAGKGSNRRSTQDDNSYRSNYDLIFGKKPNPVPTSSLTVPACAVPALPETAVDGILQYQKEQDESPEENT